jgi:hypothetical protein
VLGKENAARGSVPYLDAGLLSSVEYDAEGGVDRKDNVDRALFGACWKWVITDCHRRYT